MILPASIPTGSFDVMVTLPSHQHEALQKAIEQRFGFTARPETRETDVLMLKVKDPGLLAAHASKPESQRQFKPGKGSLAFVNSPISFEARELEGLYLQPIFDRPVIVVEPGLTGNYDLTFQWKDENGKKQAFTDELARAGLELVPTNMPVELLVVEKGK
jgi:uncharacterized protein (TIGR03435 family)